MEKEPEFYIDFLLYLDGFCTVGSLFSQRYDAEALKQTESISQL